MTLINFFEILVSITGVTMSLGYFPQAYRIWKTKSSVDVSIITYAIFSIGTLIWVVYGFLIQDLPIILSFAVGVAGSWLVLGLTFYYRNQEIRHELNFLEEDRDIFDYVQKGIKTIETRAATNKYRSVKVGDSLVFKCGDNSFIKKVNEVRVFDSVESLLDYYDLNKIMPGVKDLFEAKKRFYSFPDYENKIKENGIIAFQID